MLGVLIIRYGKNKKAWYRRKIILELESFKNVEATILGIKQWIVHMRKEYSLRIKIRKF